MLDMFILFNFALFCMFSFQRRKKTLTGAIKWKLYALTGRSRFDEKKKKEVSFSIVFNLLRSSANNEVLCRYVKMDEVIDFNC